MVEQLTKVYDRETGRAAAQQGARVPLDALARTGAATACCRARSTTSRPTTCARASWSPGVVHGWNFGDGHFHDHQLLAAVQERCHFEPGELRVVTLESQPAHMQRQRYRIYDAADGLIEEGWVNVADMVDARAMARGVVGLPGRGQPPRRRAPRRA